MVPIYKLAVIVRKDKQDDKRSKLFYQYFDL